MLSRSVSISVEKQMVHPNVGSVRKARIPELDSGAIACITAMMKYGIENDLHLRFFSAGLPESGRWEPCFKPMSVSPNP